MLVTRDDSPLEDETLDAALDHYREHGYVRLGKLVDAATLTELRSRIEAIMLGEVTWPGLFFQADSESGRYEDAPIGLGYQGPSLGYRKIEKLELDPLFRDYMESPLLERIVRRRIEGDIALYRAIVMNKSAAGGSDLPWHQDGGSFWGLDRDPELQIWTALDDAPLDGGCLEIVPGTHKLGLATPLGGVIPPEVVARERGDERKVLVPVVAGEIVLIHNYVWHRSAQSLTGRPRRALSVCYMSAATRCRRKKRAPRQFVRLFQR
jgi:phytanoyl-CoA hydroxylase